MPGRDATLRGADHLRIIQPSLTTAGTGGPLVHARTLVRAGATGGPGVAREVVPMSGFRSFGVAAAMVAALVLLFLVASQQATPAGAAQRGGPAAAGVGVVPPPAVPIPSPCLPGPSCRPPQPTPTPTPTPQPTPTPTPQPTPVKVYAWSYGPVVVTGGHWKGAYAGCGTGSWKAMGGGWTGTDAMPDVDTDHPVVVMASRPSDRAGQPGAYTYPEPDVSAGGAATGWYVAVYNPEGGTTYSFRVWVMCWRP